MINFQEQYQSLKAQFSLENDYIKLHDSEVDIFVYDFKSEFSLTQENDVSEADAFQLQASSIELNESFRYPVFVPRNRTASLDAIVMMHGLNERNWDKYLVWAHYLVEKTGKAVILFPIAFHMNRSPLSWQNPRQMRQVAKHRSEVDESSNTTSFLNAALSSRLNDKPEQFFISGAQSYQDVTHLVHLIKEGAHPLFDTTVSVDFFAYSIGAFLSEILFISNPKELFTHSKLFIFCGGPTFDKMNGVSKFIMDRIAFGRLRHLFLNHTRRQIRKQIKQQGMRKFGRMWRSFTAMLRMDKRSRHRKQFVKQYNNQLLAVALKQDKVMPPEAIYSTLNFGKYQTPVEVMDFPFTYSHENPFPVGKKSNGADLDKAFESVFAKAIDFFN